MQTHDGIDDDRALLGGLPHDLTMDLALGRHIDDEVAADLRLAAEPPPGREGAALIDEALLDRAPRARVVGARIRARAWRIDPSATSTWQRPQTPRPPQTESRSTPSRAGRVEQARSVGERAALARGVKTTRSTVTTELISPASVTAAVRARHAWRAPRGGACRTRSRCGWQPPRLRSRDRRCRRWDRCGASRRDRPRRCSRPARIAASVDGGDEALASSSRLARLASGI